MFCWEELENVFFSIASRIVQSGYFPRFFLFLALKNLDQNHAAKCVTPLSLFATLSKVGRGGKVALTVVRRIYKYILDFFPLTRLFPPASLLFSLGPNCLLYIVIFPLIHFKRDRKTGKLRKMWRRTYWLKWCTFREIEALEQYQSDCPPNPKIRLSQETRAKINLINFCRFFVVFLLLPILLGFLLHSSYLAASLLSYHTGKESKNKERTIFFVIIFIKQVLTFWQQYQIKLFANFHC